MAVDKKVVIILGAGPAGLTAAYELLQAGYTPILIEQNSFVGGISATIEHNGNYIDMGGHRFFSKSTKILNWWFNFLPLDAEDTNLTNGLSLFYQGQEKLLFNQMDSSTQKLFLDLPKTEKMMIRRRRSRILFMKKFFDYPLKLSFTTLINLGLWQSIRIFTSYVVSKAKPIVPEVTLEDFFINRFGRRLYLTFFKSYTEKVWGKSCDLIPATWGYQRVKGLSLIRFMIDGAIKLIPFKKYLLPNRKTETSLIEYFLYPPFGPGQLWKKVADLVSQQGGQFHMNCSPLSINFDSDKKVRSVSIRNSTNSTVSELDCDYLISSIAVDELLSILEPQPPTEIMQVAEGLKFRALITVGVLFKTGEFLDVPDNWIYVQTPGLTIGRIQIFNNWSPYLVSQPDTTWVGAELFCEAGDSLWAQKDSELVEMVMTELCILQLVKKGVAPIDSKVIKVPKAYPSYVDGYKDFSVIRTHLDEMVNLFTIGRNGMHRYNNQDHSMLAAMEAVRLIKDNLRDRSALWDINTEDDYQESK